MAEAPGAEPRQGVVPEPGVPVAPLHDDDAWDWGGESAHGQSFDPAAAEYLAAGWSASDHPQAAATAAQARHEPDWFEQPLAPVVPSPTTTPAGERAASALEGLAQQLRSGVLQLGERAALDSEEAVLASVLAALFARRPH